jgi:hypothetical protein
MDMTLADLFQLLMNKIFNEAGLVAVLLFCLNIYQAKETKASRKENSELHNKILTLAVEQTKTNSESNKVLDKIIDMLTENKNEDRSCHYKRDKE